MAHPGKAKPTVSRTEPASAVSANGVSGASRRDWGWGLLGAALLHASFPPWNLSWLAWVAPAFWIHLALRDDLWQPGTVRRLYLVGWLFWMAALQWVRLPHPATYAGWVVLAGYLAIYVPWFIGATHWLIHRARWPAWLAAPVVWMGLEFIRAYLFSGFALVMLGHTQVNQTALIQLASIGGAYLVGGLIVHVAAALATAVHDRRRGWIAGLPIVVATSLLAISAWWGAHRMVEPQGAEQEPSARVALIQGSIDTRFDDEHPEQTAAEAMRQYFDLTRQAASQFAPLDLVIWPESMFGYDAALVVHQPGAARPPEFEGSDEQYAERLNELVSYGNWKAGQLAQLAGAHALVGTQVWEADEHGRRLYNSAFMIDPAGNLVGRYDKVHIVMFGEYIPLGEWFPWIYRFTPLPNGLTPGRESRLFRAASLRISPSICFENTVPHLIRRQVRQLQREGLDPNCLVTVTNDGWFWGSSLLDLHLACGVFRAVELDLPMLVAANTGFSAHVTSRGRIAARGPRRDRQAILAEVRPGRGQTWYGQMGDVPYWPMAVIAAWPLIAAASDRWRRPRKRLGSAAPHDTLDRGERSRIADSDRANQ